MFAAEASECGGELRGWQESAPGGGLSASPAAGESAELRDRRDHRQLSSPAASLHRRVGKVCQEHRPQVRSVIRATLLAFRG